MTTTLQVKVDYDVSRWIMIPPEGSLSWDEWATRNSKIWARETGRPEESNWAELLDTMLLSVAHAQNAAAWDARLVHLLTPPGEGPSAGLVNLIMTQAEGSPQQSAEVLIEPNDPELIRPPDVVRIPLPSGAEATSILRYITTPDGMMVNFYLIWRAHQSVDLVWTTSSYDIGRVLVMYNDVIELAKVTQLVTTESDAG